MGSLIDNILNKKAAVLIATFSPWVKGNRLPTNGSYEPLREFFVLKVKKLVMIDQTTPGSDLVLPRIEVYENSPTPKIHKSSILINILKPFLLRSNRHGTQMIFKLRDFLSVVDWCIRDRIKYDFFIGLESINAFAGIFMKKFGFVEKVVYYVSDYSPKRYSSKIMNWLYIMLDRYCASKADYIWDVSKAIQSARVKAGLNPDKSVPCLHVPNALFPDQIKYLNLSRIIPYTIVFMGTLGRENGPDLIIEAMPKILDIYPKTVFHVIGGNRTDIARLKNLSIKLNVFQSVKFYGFVFSGIKMSSLIRKFYVGVAPYRASFESPRFYGDAGKIRAYVAAGLPVISSQVPPLGEELKDQGGALVVKDNKEEFADAIIKIFKNRKLYLRMRNKAIRFAQDNTWENSFNNAFTEMGYKLS